MEIVHEGWLIKSPPEKRIWRAKWRRRWFVLRHSGQIPGQYLLEYYTDTSCKKQKGKIDLDQCEQVDAGLAFESRKLNYRFMFDIRTPKRIYLLVAETEGEMNKWVDCICAVCGLKMHADEEPPPPEQMALTVTNQPSQTSSLEGSFFPEETALDSPTSPSGPYIPISECTTGKAPLFNGSYLTLNRFNTVSCLDDAPPPPPPKSDRGYVGEMYDLPRQIHPPSLGELRTSPDPNTEELYKVPPLLRTPTTPSERDVPFGDDEWTPSMPPKVNWETYPQESDGPDSPFSSGPNHPEKCNDKSSHKLHSVRISSTSDSHHSREIYENVSVRRDSTSDNDCHNPNAIFVAPPRPPKPAHLIETIAPHSSYQNITLSTKVMPPASNFVGMVNSYDVPVPSSQSTCIVGKSPTASVGSFRQKSDSNTDSSHVLVPSPVDLDEMYDFPRSVQDNKLSAMPPAPPHSLTREKKHAYSNAPAGYTGNVFTYEVKTTHCVGENYLSMDRDPHRLKPELYTDMSGDNRSPTAVYSNLPSPMLKVPLGSNAPPAVHRDLKPKRRLTVEDGVVHSRSCSSASSTDVSAKSPSPVEAFFPPAVHRDLKPKRTADEVGRHNLLTLAPPPVCRIRSTNSKRSFRKPKTSVSPTPTSQHRHHHHHHHHHRGGKHTKVSTPNNRRSDQSSSDDDQSSSGGSRRNSDDQHKIFFPTPISSRREPDIQYLDLELEAVTLQSPKSPPTTSTVYKTVDFVKTKAFNEMRQNVEETYRKSQ